MILKIKPVVLERVNLLSDIKKMNSEGELGYYFENPEKISAQNLIWKKSDKDQTIKHLESVKKIISENEIKGKNSEEIKSFIWPYAEENGRGDVLWPLRYSLSGADRSPDPFTLISILGKEVSVDRIENAIEKLKNA
jgi:glutamyl/glutaminyl-tRNA synthetase